MRIDVSGLKQRLGEHRTESASEPVPSLAIGGDEVRFDEPAAVTAELYNTGKGIAAEVTVAVQAELHCSRCLKAFRVPLEVRFHEEFRQGGPPGVKETRPESATAKGRRHKAPEPEPEEDNAKHEEFSPYSGDVIDLTQSIQENVFLSLPMKPLCRRDCPGLCPKCGHDLNEGPCGCGEPDSDPRLFALRELWDKNSSKH